MPRLTLTDEQVGYLKSLIIEDEDRVAQAVQALKILGPEMLSDIGRNRAADLEKGLKLANETAEALSRKQGQRAKRVKDEGVEYGC